MKGKYEDFDIFPAAYPNVPGFEGSGEVI